MTKTYNNGATPKVGDVVIVLANDYATVLTGTVVAVFNDGNIRLDSHGPLVPAFNAIPIAAAHVASTTGITVPQTISYVAQAKGKN